ncbi:MAG: hypothetical protein ACI8RZ_003273 [Myxococcota bacterium]|jgi:hypothetical protein
MAEDSWSLSYSDGSNNHLRVWPDGAAVRYAYTPTTPAQSSSGSYSGGKPAGGLIPNEFVLELWSRVQALAGHSEWHTDVRVMGSGAFTVAIGDDEHHFRVKPCVAMSDFRAWAYGSLNLGQR